MSILLKRDLLQTIVYYYKSAIGIDVTRKNSKMSIKVAQNDFTRKIA